LTGFKPAEWESMPWGRKGRKARSIWVAVKRTTGVAPTLIRYIPPQPSRSIRASWEIEHETRSMTLTGTAEEVLEQIEEVMA